MLAQPGHEIATGLHERRHDLSLDQLIDTQGPVNEGRQDGRSVDAGLAQRFHHQDLGKDSIGAGGAAEQRAEPATTTQALDENGRPCPVLAAG